MSVTAHPGEMITNHPDSVGPIQTGINPATWFRDGKQLSYTDLWVLFIYSKNIGHVPVFRLISRVDKKGGSLLHLRWRSIIQQSGFFLAESPREAPAFIV